jgi:hypothetical protein
MVVANGSFTDDAECVDGGTPKVMFGAAEFLRGLDFVLKRRDLRSLLQGLLNKRGRPEQAELSRRAPQRVENPVHPGSRESRKARRASFGNCYVLPEARAFRVPGQPASFIRGRKFFCSAEAKTG